MPDLAKSPNPRISRWFATRVSAGVFVGILIKTGYLDTDRNEHAAVCSVYEGSEFPRKVITPFKRAFLSNATCARCGQTQSDLMLRSLALFGHSEGDERPHVVCGCGHPVWKISETACFEAGRAMSRVEYSERRRELLTSRGKKHSRAQLREILGIQKNRCIYCNAPFGDGRSPNRDHIWAVSAGGSDSAWNIVMACRSCNARRGTIPFRTYCKTLSPLQNRRILGFLIRRSLSVKADQVGESEFATFIIALRMHNPRDRNYRWIIEHSSRRRNYAERNALLPTVPQLLRRMRSVLK
jgi:5-methylcytosine-specific restriction endonuclease McrA